MSILQWALIALAVLTWLPAGQKITAAWKTRIKSELMLPVLAGWVLVAEALLRLVVVSITVLASIVLEAYARIHSAVTALVRPSGTTPKSRKQAEADIDAA